MFGHGKYGNANHIPTIHGFPALALIGVTALSLLSETLASETTIDGGHQAMERRESPPPLAKIPCHESNEIDGLSIGGPSIDIWTSPIGTTNAPKHDSCIIKLNMTPT